MSEHIFSFTKSMKPRGYMVAASIMSIGGFLNGYDTGSIGAITTMPYFADIFGVLSPSLRGFTVSFLLLAAAVPGFFAGQFADRYGQLRIIQVGASIFALGAVLEAAASKLSMFLVGRALVGIGEGLWLTNVSVYITEIAPRAQRGMLVSIPQMMTVTGICAGYFTCYGSIHIESPMSYRLPFVIESICGGVLAIACLFLPSSPRWLLLHGRRDEALRALERLNVERAEAEKDILRPESQSQERMSTWKGFGALFHRQYRLRTMLGLFVLGMVQFSGIDGVLYYAPILFSQAGLPAGTSSFLASGVSAILMLLITVPAFLYADAWGRRSSIITGGLIMSSCMFLIGILYATNSVHADDGAARWVVIVTIFVFALTYCVTWAIVAKIYASEIQPARTRASANSIAQAMNFLTNWIVAFATPVFLARSTYGAYFLFGGLSLFTVLVLTVLMPETRGYSLEAIQDGFRRPPMNKVLTRLVSKITGRGASQNGLRSHVDRAATTMSGALQESEGSTALANEFELGSITQRIDLGTA